MNKNVSGKDKRWKASNFCVEIFKFLTKHLLTFKLPCIAVSDISQIGLFRVLGYTYITQKGCWANVLTTGNSIISVSVFLSSH